MKLYIKNMVCNRCRIIVSDELKKLGFVPVQVALGEAETVESLSDEQYQALSKSLEYYGFEMLHDHSARLIEKIKTTVIEMVHEDLEFGVKKNHSQYIAEKVGKDYAYLSHLFSDTEAITLEKYIIKHKVERVKELLTYNELSLSEIADKTDYSSVQHLSRQFREITGMTPSQFKKLRTAPRKTLDKV